MKKPISKKTKKLRNNKPTKNAKLKLKNSAPKLFDNIRFGLLYTLVSAIIIIVGTFLAIQYAKGNYRFTKKGFASQTGLLNANSFPTAAEVYLDGKLVSATDDTLYLEPGEYLVEIKKEGFSPWSKTLTIQKELVTQTHAQLFPVAPGLTPLTFSGVTRVSTSPDGQKVLLFTNTAQNIEKNGLYILELSGNVLSLQRNPKFITAADNSINLETAEYIWSPSSDEVMVLGTNKTIMLEAGAKVILANQENISWKQKQILSEWEEDMYRREREFLRKFPEEIVEILTTDAKNVYLSPDKKRALYTAITELTLPENIVPPLPARNTQEQARSLEIGGIYIYDREEDTNFQIGTETGDPSPVTKNLLATDAFANQIRTLEASPSTFSTLQSETSLETAQLFNAHHNGLNINTLQWFPDSKHILFAQDGQIHIMEYDGGNNTVVYSGPFVNNFVYPWPDGSRILILTSFSPDAPENVYSVDLE